MDYGVGSSAAILRGELERTRPYPVEVHGPGPRRCGFVLAFPLWVSPFACPRLPVSGSPVGGGGVRDDNALGRDGRRLLDRRSPSVGRSRLVRRLEPGASVPGAPSAPGTPLPDGPALSSWVCVPRSPDFQPRLASPDVDFYSLFTKLRCDGSSSCGRRSAEGLVLLEGRVGATSSGPFRGRL